MSEVDYNILGVVKVAFYDFYMLSHSKQKTCFCKGLHYFFFTLYVERPEVGNDVITIYCHLQGTTNPAFATGEAGAL